MAMKFMTNLDLQNNQLLNVVLQTLASDPSSPVNGQIWYNSASDAIKYKDASGVQVLVSNSSLTTTLGNYQLLIEASGILKGDGSGGVTAATAGTDYSYAVLSGSSNPTTSTEGAVNQLYVNTTSSRLFVCTAASSETYTWLELTTDISTKQDKIDVTTGALLKQGDSAGSVVAATAGTDYAYPEIVDSTAPTTSTEGAVGQQYLDTSTGVNYICTAVNGSNYTWTRVTVDISGKQDTIDSSHKLPASLVSGLATVATTGSYTDLSDTPDIPEASGSTDIPEMDGTAAVGTSDAYARADHVHPSDTSKQDAITASGILKGDGSGGVTAATAGTDYQAPISVTADKVLVSDSNGAVSASSVTATELGYLSGATGNIQGQIDDIPKYTYKDSVTATVSDGATQAEINTAAVAAITTAYPTANKWDAVVVAVTFTPSDVVKDGVYYYNGTNWVFLYYVTTGIQLANGTTAGLIQEATTDSDLTIASGVATVNTATALRTARDIGISGLTATAASFDGSTDVNITVTAVPTSLLSGTVAVANGGTGKSSITDGSVLVGNSSGGFDELAIDTTVTDSSSNLVTSGAVSTAISAIESSSVHKYAATNPVLTPTSGTCEWTVTHNLNTRAVNVQIFEAESPYNQVIADVEATTVNTVTISMVSSSDIAAGTYQVAVLG